MRSKASTYIHGFTNKNDEVLVGWVRTNPNDVYSMKSCCFSNNPVKDRLHQITVEVSGTLHFSISVDLLCGVAPWNYFHRRLRKKRKRKTWSLIFLDELATFCATFSTPGMEPDGSQRQKKKYGGAGAADLQVHTWKMIKMVVSESVVQMVLLIFFWICLVTSISQLQKVFGNHPCLHRMLTTYLTDWRISWTLTPRFTRNWDILCLTSAPMAS